jgi:hypothetical protein
MSTDLAGLLVGLMFWVLLPLWIVAGIGDYLLHRRTGIERTSGIGESRLHVLQAAQIGIALLAGLFLEITGAVLAILLVCVLAHTLTALWDTSHTDRLRHISPLEQHVHSHLEYIPMVAVAILVVLHWDAFIGLFQGAPGTLRLRAEPLPVRYILAVLIPVFGLQGMLLLDEFLRCRRASVRRTA